MRRIFFAAAIAFAAGIGCDNDDERDSYVDMLICQDACEDDFDECYCAGLDGMPIPSCMAPDPDSTDALPAVECRNARTACLEKC